MSSHKTPVKNPKFIQIRLPENLYDNVTEEAHEARMSRNAWINMVLQKHVDYLHRDAPNLSEPSEPEPGFKPPWL